MKSALIGCVSVDSKQLLEDGIRKELQADTTKLTVNATPLTQVEAKQTIELWNEDTPEGLNRKLHAVITKTLGWRGGESAMCTVDMFQEEKTNSGFFFLNE